MMHLVFVGTGVSCAIPVIGHLDNGDMCACKDATENPDGPNKRNNVSLLIQVPRTDLSSPPTGDDSTVQERVNLLIDCGKTFRDAYFRVLAPRGIRYVDALLLTHGHADAMQCVEELCDLHTETHTLMESAHQQQHGGGGVGAEAADGWLPSSIQFIPTYLTPPTLREVQDISPHVVRASRHHGPAPQTREEFQQRMLSASPSSSGHEAASAVAPSSMDVFIVAEDKPTPLYIDAIHGHGLKAAATGSTSGGAGWAKLPFYSLPVEHGKNYISLGFVFGQGTAFKSDSERADEGARRARAAELKDRSCVVYISDVSEIIPPSMEFLESLVKIDLLVFDLLTEKGRSTPPHTCWDDCMPVIRRLTPTKTFFVGMFCSLVHEPSNRLWQEDLNAERARVKAELDEAEKAGRSHQPEGVLLQRFLREVESVELAYDGLELVVPL